VKSSGLAFAKILVFILFYFFWKEKKDDYGNNLEISYDNVYQLS
jgi:hypothetical protein